jgi:hypothetical protein
MPDECKEGLKCPVFKKNYNVINLRDFSAQSYIRIVSDIILKALNVYIEN